MADDGGEHGRERPDLFPLMACWETSFRNLAAGLRDLARGRTLTPRRLAALANLIYAIDRLPMATEGVSTEAHLKTESDRGRGWLAVRIDPHSLEFSSGDSSYDPQGTETHVRSILDVEATKPPVEERPHALEEMIDLENWVAEWNRRAVDSAFTFSISDDCDDMDWNQPILPDAWEALPDGV